MNMEINKYNKNYNPLFLQPNDNRDMQILEFWVHDCVCNYN